MEQRKRDTRGEPLSPPDGATGRAIVIGPYRRHNPVRGAVAAVPEVERAHEARLEEAIGLARAIDLDIVDSGMVLLSEVRPATYIGKGKVDEIAGLVKSHEAGIVVVDCALSPVQQRNLEKAWNAKVLDRTALILEIFGQRARTREGRLQVELAHLTYQRSRLVRSWTHLERQRGGFGFLGGPGETQIETDRRLIDQRISELQLRLKGVEERRERMVGQRDSFPLVSVVGYTNAGKSTLMNALTGAQVYVADQLFATLDTRTRKWTIPNWGAVLLSDTVGFVRDLPHQLVASFKSTLDEAASASLLLFVVDASDPSFRSQLEVTRTVLAEVGATEIPSLLVLNKRDRLGPEELALLKVEYPDAVFLSTRSQDDLQALRERILLHFEREMRDEELRIPFTAQGVVAEIRARMRILSEAYDAEGLTLRVRSTPENLTAIKKKLAR